MDLAMDVRCALRTLGRSPGFTTVAVLSLALGIGANTAIFTLIDNLMLKSLPVKEPERLAMLRDPAEPGGLGLYSQYCYRNYTELRDRNTVFSGLLARANWPNEFFLSENGEKEKVAGELVSGNYFEVLGVKAYIGRTFTPDDDVTPGAHPVAVLSYAFWRQRFGADASVIGRILHIQGHPFTVIGVTPPGFFGVGVGSSPAIRIPWAMAALWPPSNNWNPFDDLSWNLHHVHWGSLRLMGRLKPGISFQQAEAFLKPLHQQIRRDEADLLTWGSFQNLRTEANRKEFLERGMAVSPGGRGSSGLRQRFSQPLMALMALVGVVLLIACSTVANLLLARGTARRREIAVRLALGAGPLRLTRQLLMESLALACGGGALGVLAAWWGAGALVAALPGDASTPGLQVAPDLRVLGFTLGVSLLTGVLFGLAPAFQALRTEVVAGLKDQGAALTGHASHMALRKGLIVAQVALSVLLLAGAGLFVRTLRSLKSLDTGMDRTHVLQVEIDPDPYRHFTNDQKQQYWRRLMEQVEALPGVRSAATTFNRVLDGGTSGWGIGVDGQPPRYGENVANTVTSRFFETLGIPLAAGRVWSPRDDFLPIREAVVSQSFARYHFGDRSPIGHTLTTWKPGKWEIVGVVNDSKYRNLRANTARSVYLSRGEFWDSQAPLYVRTIGDPARLIGAVRREAQTLNRDAYVYDVRTLEDQVDEMLVQERLVAWLASFFGLLAMLLSAIGLYGVIAYSVLRRTREIGLRVALGAGRRHILRMVLREVLTLAGIGVALGVPAALAAARLAKTLLFGVAPVDTPSLLGAVLLMCAVAMLAGYLPARRATRVDPMVALRQE